MGLLNYWSGLRAGLLAGLLTLGLAPPVRAQLSPFYEWQNPRPLGAQLVDIHAFNDSTAYAAGLDNVGWRTTDYGRTWQRTAMGLTNGELKPVRLCFKGDTLGWVAQWKFFIAAGGIHVYRSQLSRTTNGGRTWQGVSSLNLSQYASLTDVHFVTRRIGHVLYNDDRGARLRRTTDGGATWQPAIDLTVPIGGLTQGQRVQFLTPTTGWVAVGGGFAGRAGGGLFYTTDAGQTWTDRSPLGSGAVGYYALTFADAQHGWAFGEGPGQQPAAYRTTDGGLTWQAMSGLGLVLNVTASDAQHAVASAYLEDWYTADGGLTWQLSPTGRSGPVGLLPSGTVWGAHFAHGTQRSTDFGATWSQPAALPLGSLYGEVSQLTFLDADRGWAALQYSGRFFRTTTRGARWQVVSIDSAFSRQQLAGAPLAATFPDIDTAFAAVFYRSALQPGPTEHGILRTGDGGQSWQLYRPPGHTPPLRAIADWTSRHVCAVGDSGTVLVSHDGGLTWLHPATPVPTQALLAVAWASPQRVCAVGGDGLILLSTDGGVTWTSRPNPNTGTTAGFANVQWRTPTEAWLTAGAHRFIRSTDGGLTWNMYVAPEAPGAPVPYQNYYEAFRLQILDSARLVYADYRPVYSGDGGGTWSAISDSYVLPINARHFVDRYNGWFVGFNASLLHYSEKFVRADTALATTTRCAGDSLALPFTLTGTFDPPEQAFVAELSDATGRWRHPVRVGQGSTSPLTVRLPATLAAGTHYRLRVSRPDRSVIGGDNGRDLTIYPRPSATIAPTDSVRLCVGDSVQLTAPAGYGQYQWSTGATTASVWVRQAGSYSVQVAQGGGCYGPASAPVVVRLTSRPAAPVITMQPQGSGIVVLTSSSPAGNQWFFNGSPLPGATGATYAVTTGAQSGSYSVQVTQQGCASPLAAAVPVSVLGAAEVLAVSAVNLAPNPARGSVAVRAGGGATLAGVTLTDLAGRTVVRVAGSGGPEVAVPLGGVPAGTYLLRAALRGGADFTRRLVVER